MADPQRTEKILNFIGLGLLAACFAVSLGRIAWMRWDHAPASGGEEPVTIRIAHWQLEGGLREAFDAVAAEYQKLHPHVRIVQLPVPERIFPNWLTTQLVGGTAPDIIALGFGMTDERLARYFEPITDLVDLPNPWNKGTPLENTPLRETFLDGLESGFNGVLLEYYGLPTSAHTVRMYYNLDLLREVTGSETLPKTYQELAGVARKTADYARRTGQQIIPIAGSRYNSPAIMNRLFSSQTEQLAGRLAYDFPGSRPNAAFVAEGAASGKWSLESPEIRAGLDLCRELGQFMQPGFLTVRRDDASFYFVQGKALMIATGSWDIISITSQANFPIAVGHIPTPAVGDLLGPFGLGPIVDHPTTATRGLGLTYGSKHPEIARDFLLFLASQPMNQLFSEMSNWPPSITGVQTSKELRIFAPNLEGHPGGFTLDFAGADTSRLITTSLNQLTGPAGSVDAFIAAVTPSYPGAIRSDMTRQALNARANAQRSDTTLGALAWQALAEPDNPQVATKIDLLLQNMSGADFNAYRLRRTVNRL